MLRRAEEMRQEIAANLRGGQGQAKLVHILESSQDELNGKGKMFAQITLLPGSSVGWHQHVGDSEAYYILSGQGIVNDNGTKVTVQAGDVVLTRDGEYHSIENNGDEDLVFIALILLA
ncbi:MAG: cupin domain-containing protein [Firmicutes bacterium]|nr:cupin domain-containing protein [Bacillota bacterium]